MTNPKIGRRGALQLCAGAAALMSTQVRAQTAEVKVALLAPMSGAWARQGHLMKLGGDMAIDDINAAGGVKALGGAKLRLMVFDAGDSAEKAKNAAQRMVSDEPDLVGGTGAWLSSFSLSVTEVTERGELPWLTESYSDAITSRGFRYVFQTAMPAEAQSRRALPIILELGKQAGVTVKRMGIVADNTASTVSFVRALRADIASRNLKLGVDEIYTPPVSDVTSMVQRIRSSRPQLLFLGASNVSDNKLLLDKMKEMGLSRGRVPSFGNGGAMAASEMIDIVGTDQLEGLMVILANWGGKNNEALVRRFTARTKEPWMGQDSIQTYFDMMLLREALERAGAANRHKVADALRSMDLRDDPALLLPGKHVKFDERGRIADPDMVIVQWQDGVAPIAWTGWRQR